MLTSVHLPLTCTCLYECDHCFLHCGPRSEGALLSGGPVELARTYDLPDDEQFVDHCHMCYVAPKRLLHRFSAILGPQQVYGIQPHAQM